MAVYIRLARTEDLPQIMNIIAEAKQLMKDDGNPQWQKGKPNEAILAADIEKKRAYCLISDQNIAGIAVLLTTPEPTYDQIDGSWNNQADPYATIHRIAISTKFRGQQLGKIFMSNLITCGIMLGIHNFRIDTHEVNKRMQGLIKATGFEYRGIILIDSTEDGARNAYELNLPSPA